MLCPGPSIEAAPPHNLVRTPPPRAPPGRQAPTSSGRAAPPAPTRCSRYPLLSPLAAQEMDEQEGRDGTSHAAGWRRYSQDRARPRGCLQPWFRGLLTRGQGLGLGFRVYPKPHTFGSKSLNEGFLGSNSILLCCYYYSISLLYTLERKSLKESSAGSNSTSKHCATTPSSRNISKVSCPIYKRALL